MHWENLAVSHRWMTFNCFNNKRYMLYLYNMIIKYEAYCLSLTLGR